MVDIALRFVRRHEDQLVGAAVMHRNHLPAEVLAWHTVEARGRLVTDGYAEGAVDREAGQAGCRLGDHGVGNLLGSASPGLLDLDEELGMRDVLQ